MADLYYARRPFGYGDGMLDMGQVVELAGFRNDEKLVRLGYLEQVRGKVVPLACRLCGGKFVDDGARERHGRRSHPDKPLSEAEQLRRDEREAEQLQHIAPLYLDKTSEAKGVKPQRGRRA